MGTVAGAEPSAPPAPRVSDHLAQGKTPQVGADPYHDQTFRPDRPCAVLPRVGQVGTAVHSCLGNLPNRTLLDDDRRSPPTHRDTFTPPNRAPNPPHASP